MKSLLPAILLVFLAASCERPAGAGGGGGIDELAEEREALEASRRELDRARRELEAQREAMQAEREARQAELDEAGELAGAEADDLSGEEPEVDGGGIEDESDSVADGEFAEDSGDGDLGGPDAAGETALEFGAEPLPVADYNLFYDGLADQGDWYETIDYGYVFQPSVVVGDADWRPYLHGRWHYTDYGWYWDSQEPFGWATYHYGRWVRIVGRGWCWVPGFRWAPSWVCWREGGGGLGWAPLPPETCWLGDDGGYGHGVEADFGVSLSWFVFMEARHLDQPVWRHCVPRGQNRRWWERSRPCTRIAPHRGRIYCGGPRHEGRLPLRPLGFEMLDGLRDRGRGRAAGRPDLVDGRIRAFAPGIDVPWNPRLQPGRTAGWLGRVEVDRDGLGTNAARIERARDARREWIRRAANWREDIGVGRARMSDLLEANRRRVADGTTRRTTRSGFARLAAAEETPPEGGTGGRRTRANREAGARADAPAAPEDALAGQPGPVDGMVRDQGRGGLPRGVRPDRSSGLDFLVDPAQRGEATADPRQPGDDSAGPSFESASGDVAGSGSAARRRAAANAVPVEAPAAIPAPPQARQAGANAAARGNAAADARQRGQFEARQRQEQVRRQQEQARQSQLEQAQRQQELLREQAARAEAQRRQQQAEARAREQARQEQNQQQAAARQQAAQRAREQQEQLRQAQQEAMQQRQEQARQQAAEQARQQAAERARQQQEQQARQQSQRREQADRIRQQQERLREAAGQRRR